ncbi:exocyst complex component EXO84C [Morus notabilis]|uniref:exocyst complex component EXO84C n=1 Tax=Morus notabilis TaxID=981085 RepID=UPI000CED235C|nr:exocyst complex component EXO84C [Morus notabilis]
MESSSTSSRFRFRDHSEVEKSAGSGTDSDYTSVSSDRDDEPDLGSMTGKGIKHFCSELLELKLASNEEFHKNIFSNYTAFIRIFEEAERLENELVQLKEHLITQKQLVKELVNITCSEVLSEEIMDPIVEELVYSEPSPSSELEDHINNVSEALDLLLSENRMDEALDVLELEHENFQKMQFEVSCSMKELSLYSSAISDRKAVLTLRLTRLAENRRIAAPELQKALYGLCRLGESHLATQLMLKYYHARIETGIHSLQCSKSFSYGVYIRELAKLVFSLISQAAKSFVMLYGETSPYTKELIQWAGEETKIYVECFNQYLESISDISGGLSTAAQDVQISLSFCSLLETQRLVLRPYLVKYIRPSMEEILSAHIQHIKKVISIFTATDDWTLSRYLVSGIISEGCSSMVVGEEPEYCLLTSSGRKFVTLMQAITEDVFPLVSLQMEGSIFFGLITLFKEYVIILENALIYGTDITEKGGSRINIAASVQQQISILANLSALEQLFLRMVRGINGGNDHINAHAISYQQHELTSFTLSMHEASSRLTVCFCQHYIRRIMSMESTCELAQIICNHAHGDPSVSHDPMPSITFQVLFLELRKLERLAEANGFEKEWLLEMLREIVETIFEHISENKEIWATTNENLTMEYFIMYKQFVLDLRFLVEITKYGGYFSNNPSLLEDLVKSAFLSSDLIPESDVKDNERMIDSVNEVIQKLLEIEKTMVISSEESTSIQGEETREDQSEFAVDDSTQDDARSLLEIVATDEPEIATLSKMPPSLLNADSGPQEMSSGMLEMDSNSNDTDTPTNLKDSSMGFGIMRCENIVGEADDETVEIGEKDNVPALPL